MRHTYRYKNNFQYWTDRWEDLEVDSVMSNKDIYPLKYSENLINNDKHNSILEAGCGNGRLLKYYHNNGYDIFGIDFIDSAVKKLKKSDNSLKVEKMSIFNTNFSDNKFKFILAFGLYHNFKDDILNALIETNRILSNSGVLCASFRADNIQNKIIDYLYEKRYKGDRKEKFYHKSNFKKSDLKKMFKASNFKIIEIKKAVNMSFLYKMRLFRASKQNNFNENIGRNQGYSLNKLGEIINAILLFISTNQFCNVYVVYASKIK